MPGAQTRASLKSPGFAQRQKDFLTLCLRRRASYGHGWWGGAHWITHGHKSPRSIRARLESEASPDGPSTSAALKTLFNSNWRKKRKEKVAWLLGRYRSLMNFHDWRIFFLKIASVGVESQRAGGQETLSVAQGVYACCASSYPYLHKTENKQKKSWSASSGCSCSLLCEMTLMCIWKGKANSDFTWDKLCVFPAHPSQTKLYWHSRLLQISFSSSSILQKG